jgi:hypothetical protein
MTRTTAFQRFRTCTILLLATAYLPGCIGWRTQNVAPVEELKQPVPNRLRVHLKDGRTVFLSSARVENDSLVGTERAEDAPGRAPGRSAFLLSEVTRTEARGPKAGGTLAILGGILLVGTFIALHNYEPNLR